MEKFDNSVTETEMNLLREGIQTKYKAYRLLDRDRFPDFEYNTNRANYEPLRASFEEEFFVVRGLDRTQSSIHIPSTNTLALLFTANSYVPGRKILNTCRSYAEGKATSIADAGRFATIPHKVIQLKKNGRILVSGLLVLGATVVYVVTTQRSYKRAVLSPSGLSIHRPTHNKTVPRELLAAGTVVNADTVWIVVRAAGGLRYWVQPPIKVASDNTWQGGIYIGSEDKGDIGIRSQIRAFVNPANELKDGDVLHSWPKAELSSGIVEVTRGTQRE